ncbi:MAG TPA: hypothetical protein VLE91_04965 [Candidatus Saccharimonadales bacterium]|nr:hypothetical protein [Candidatus Saccharimonadales bacterium]
MGEFLKFVPKKFISPLAKTLIISGLILPAGLTDENMPLQATSVHAETTDPLEQIPFNWQRNEVLFGPNAGFEKATNGQSLSVYVTPGLAIDLKATIAPWNKLAGWDLFIPSDDVSGADISFVPNNTTRVQPAPDFKASYSGCKININPKDYKLTMEAQHEIGHCLGLVDFVTTGTDTKNYVNPQKCDDPSKLYLGVMSYCSWEDSRFWFGAHDRKLLELCGYSR